MWWTATFFGEELEKTPPDNEQRVDTTQEASVNNHDGLATIHFEVLLLLLSVRVGIQPEVDGLFLKRNSLFPRKLTYQRCYFLGG